MSEVDAALREIADRLAREQGGQVGVAATFLPTGESVRLNEDILFPTASVVKVAIVCELYTQTADGRCSLDEPVIVAADDIVAGSGVLCNLTPGLALPLRDLAMLTISVSDNTASNLCLRAVGGPSVVNDSMRHRWGMQQTTIHRPIKFNLEPDDPPYTATGSPADMLRLLILLQEGKIRDRATSDSVLRLMGEVNDNDHLPRYLDLNPYSDELGTKKQPFQVMHKTGASTGVRNDAALITRGNEALAVCAYTKNVRDSRWTAANAASAALAEIGKLLCEKFFS